MNFDVNHYIKMETVEDRLECSSSEDYVQRAALVWVMEDMCDHYDNFTEMLYGETDDRWILQHYLALKLNVTCDKKRDSAMWELGWFLERALDNQELFSYHAENCGKFLKYIYPEDKVIAELFTIYEKVAAVDKNLSSDEKREIIESLVRDNKYARELFPTGRY